MASRTLHIVFDGHCGFCRRALKIVKAVDLFGALRYYDSHDSRTFQLFPQLQGANIADAMYTIADGEPPHEGFFSFRRLIWSSPLLWLLIPIFYFPGAAFFGPRVYGWVARNRSKFGCGTDACDLPRANTQIGS
jgi:predicted DCC family thiol-disulfide oxidoreductase YuxK